jgi:hypothetical protein
MFSIPDCVDRQVSGLRTEQKLPSRRAHKRRPINDNAPPPPPMGRLQRGKDGCPELPPSQANRPNNMMMISPFGACIMATRRR